MKRIGVLTSGGDSPGMNAGIRAVVRAGTYHGIEVMGIHRGYQGLLDGDITLLGPRDVSGIINRGGTILRTARCKPFYEVEGRATAAAQMTAHYLDGLVVIGGDGSYHGALALHEEHGIPCIGMPGTIDNDIGGTDYTIGFDTAMNTAMKAIDNLRDTAASHDRIFFVEVMGRECGQLAMIAGLAGGAEDILIPESLTEISDVIAVLRNGRAAGKSSMIIVVAEGDDAGDAFAVSKAIAAESEFKDTRVTVLGHLQRGGSPTAFDRVLASRMGVHAVDALLQGESGKMVGIQSQDIVLCPLALAWEKKSSFDEDMLRAARILGT